MSGRHDRVSRTELTGEIIGDFDPDYGDRYRIAPSLDQDAGQWASSSLRGAAQANGAFSRLVWHGVLRFDLAPLGTPGTLVGWRIRCDTPERFELETDGSLMAGRMVFLIEDDEVSWATMLRFHHRAGRLIWAAAGHAHRALVPRSLRSARRELGPER